MPNFVLNKNAQQNGDHEVHNSDNPCHYLHMVVNREDLGWHLTCSSAITRARSLGYWKANGCAFCVPACHTQ